MSFVNKYDKYDSVPLAYVEEMTTTTALPKKNLFAFQLPWHVLLFKIICYKKGTKPMFINLIFKYEQENARADHPGFDESNCIIKCWITEQQQKLEFPFYFIF